MLARWGLWPRAGLVLFGLSALAVVPTSVVESGPPICLSRLLLDLECWGCGMTRAFSCLAHGDLDRALAFNRGVVIVGPLLAFLAARWILAGRSAGRRTSPAVAR